MNIWKSVRDGFTSATRTAAPLVIMFLVILLLSLALTLPVAATMNAWVGQRTVSRELARGFDGWLLIEPWLRTATAGQEGVAASDQAAAYVLLSMMGTLLLAWLISSLPNILLGGGVLLTYSEGRFEWRRFVWGAWRWMLAFFALALIWMGVSTLVLTLGSIVLILSGVVNSILMIPLLGAVALMYAVPMAVFDYARIIAVADGTRNIFSALGRAVALIARQPLHALGLYLLMSALGLALIPLYANIIAPLIPFEWGVAAIAAQQLFIVAGLWLRLARWGGQLSLYRQVKGV